MGYALATLWHERQRFLPGILAVTFSAVLIALQCGLLLGLFSITSIPIDRTRAQVWVGSPNVLSVDIGRPIPEEFLDRLSHCPELQPAEEYLQGFSSWTKPPPPGSPPEVPNGGSELCIVIGCRLGDDAIGRVDKLTGRLRRLLTQPGSVVIDEAELERLGLSPKLRNLPTAEDGTWVVRESDLLALGLRATDNRAEIIGHPIKVVGMVRGLRSLAGPYIFCSVQTARPLIRHNNDQVTYLLARTKSGNPADARAAADRLAAEYKDMSVFTSADFSFHSRWHWLTKTRGGIALGYAALLGLLVGAVVTSQTLFAATMASMREYAILLALGIPRWRLALTVVAQAFWVGVAGTALAVPVVYGLAELAKGAVPVQLPWQLIAATSVITMAMAVFSGLAALRSLRHIEPVNLLR
jgi:putative ABC transport system permease protein